MERELVDYTDIHWSFKIFEEIIFFHLISFHCGSMAVVPIFPPGLSTALPTPE